MKTEGEAEFHFLKSCLIITWYDTFLAVISYSTLSLSWLSYIILSTNYWAFDLIRKCADEVKANFKKKT